MNILARIEEYADSQSERTAFKSRTGEITYGELWDRSGRLASEIENRMRDNRNPVIVYGHKDPMMIVCFLACVRSGRAYCPVDINTPAERIAQIAETIGEPLVLTANSPAAGTGIDISELLQGSGQVMGYEELQNLPEAGDSVTKLNPCTGDDVFYIIFTSGTTGRPKGVRITTDNLNGYLSWAVTLAGGIEKQSVFVNQAPYSFDLSVMDLYPCLAVGGTIVSVDSMLQKNNSELMEYLTGKGVNYWVSTPSFASICLAEDRFSAELMPELKGFLFCGEVLPCGTAHSLIKRFPEAKVINTYGPTESTVCVTEIEITEEMAAGSEPLPVGKPRPGTRIELDPETSEIIIIGDTVSPGYYKEPEKTAKVFFTADSEGRGEGCGDNSGSRAYRTGDRGRFDAGGNLCCDGRIDNQVKLHGYRIEIEDIESNLAGVPGVRRGAVAPRISDGKVESLTAFVIREDETITDDYAGRKSVRLALKEKMPSYMVPKRIIFVDDLPVTNNGKLDRNKLKEMA